MGGKSRGFVVEVDGEEVVVPRRRVRKNKTAKPEQKVKFEPEHKAKPIVAQTENQKLYLDSLQKNRVTVGKGSAGSGKTFCAASVAANKYLQGEVDYIVVTRPNVRMGQTTGHWPGTIEEKMAPLLAPILSVLKKHLGPGKYEAEFGKTILIQAMEACRGRSFASTYVVVDESQNLSVEEVRSMVTRLESDSYIAFCGDDKQRDIQGVSGITYLASIIKKHNLPDCGVVEFTTDDIVRSGLTKLFVEIFEQEGSSHNIKEVK